MVWTHRLPFYIGFITSLGAAIVLYLQTCAAREFQFPLPDYNWCINVGLLIQMTMTLLAFGLPAAQGFQLHALGGVHLQFLVSLEIIHAVTERCNV